MELNETDRKELQEFVTKWKNEIPNQDIYFSFNGQGHLRYINANDEGLIRFAVKTIEAALSDEKYTNLAGEYPSEDWIAQQDEDLSIHYIEKINQGIDEYIAQREMHIQKGAETGNHLKDILYGLFWSIIVYLIFFRITN